MPFDHGNITFRACHMPKSMPKDSLERFASKAAPSLEYLRDEPQWGWVTGRHLLERDINEGNAYAGGYLHLVLRQAEKKIPGALLRAECRMTEIARLAETDGDRLGRKERKTIKENVTERLLPNMPPQLSGIPFTIDPNDSTLYVGASSQKQVELFMDFFCRTVDFEPIPLTSSVAAKLLFEVEPDSVPAVNISPALPDGNRTGTLGENFLTWLWFFTEDRQGVLPPSKLGDFQMMIEGPLVLASEGAGAFESVIRKGAPTLSAEAKAALLVGKKLRQAKIIMAQHRGEEWSTTVDANEFLFRGLKLPEGEAMDPHSVFEERITNIYTFKTVFFALFQRFIQDMTDADKRASYQTRAKTWVEERDGK